MHDNACLLQNTRIAFVMTILFAGFGTLDLLRLANTLSPVAEHGALSPFLLIVAILVLLASLRSFTCRAERLVLGLVIVDVLFKLVAVTRPRLVIGIGQYQVITATIISFSCAMICGFVGFRSLTRPNRQQGGGGPGPH